MLSWKSLEVVFIVLIVSIVLGEALGAPSGGGLLLLLLGVVVRLGGVVVPASVSILRQEPHVGEEGLRGAPVLMGQIPQTAGQVRGGRHAVALSAGHLVGGPLHRGPEEALVAGNHGLPGGGHRVGRGAHVRQRDLGASGYRGAMTDERGHQICRKTQKLLIPVNSIIH